VENVASNLAETEKPELVEHEESAKRRQIMEGAALPRFLNPLLFNAGDAPVGERIDHLVGIAVRTFLAAYRRAA